MTALLCLSVRPAARLHNYSPLHSIIVPRASSLSSSSPVTSRQQIKSGSLYRDSQTGKGKAIDTRQEREKMQAGDARWSMERMRRPLSHSRAGGRRDIKCTRRGGLCKAGRPSGRGESCTLFCSIKSTNHRANVLLFDPKSERLPNGGHDTRHDRL